MRQFILLLLLQVTLLCVNAQETFDITTYRIPKGWKKSTKDGVVIYTKSDESTGKYCMLAIYASASGSGDAQTDFQSEWNDLAVQPFSAEKNPATETQVNADGWTVIAGASTAKTESGDSYIVLTVFSGFGRKVSILANLNDQEFITFLDQFLLETKPSALLAKNKNNKSASALNSNSSISGKWAKSASSPPQYRNGVLVNLANAGYHKGQYDFKSDGTYTFHGESQFSSNDYMLIDEKGTYKVTGEKLILAPSRNKLRKVNASGAVAKTEQLSLAKRSYSWEVYYFEGIKETNLVLSAVPENILDGGFGGNSMFPNAFLYSREFVPEWRFDPLRL